MRVGIYARISRDQSEPGELDTPVDRQLKACREWCGVKNWRVVDVYEDRGRSAYRGVRREEYDRLLADVAAGRLDAVLVWKLDRLHRRAGAFYPFLTTLKEHDVALASVVESVDTSTPYGQAILGVMVVMAELEAATMGERSRAKRAAQREAGQARVGGKRMYGFEKDGKTVRTKEARLIRRSAAMIAEGVSLRAVTRLWAKQGVLSTTGRPVPPQSIRRVLLTSPLVDADVQARVTAVLTDKARVLNKTGLNRRRYLLSGSANGYEGLRCALCGEQLTAFPAEDGIRVYRCRTNERSHVYGCGKVRVRADHLERWVIGEIDAHFTATTTDHEVPDTSERELELHAAIRRDQEELGKIADRLADGVIDDDQARRTGDRLRRRIEERRAELVKLVKVETTTRRSYDWPELKKQVAAFERSYVKRGWDDYPVELEYWRSGVEATIKRVVVGPTDPPRSREWNPARAEIIWRA